MILDPLSFIDGLTARISGPMNFRFLLQPLMALFFAVRDGRKDAREGEAPYFWALFSNTAHRRKMLQNGWKSVGKVFIIAIILDLVFQIIAFRGIRPGGALVAAMILAIIPYILLRGPVNRVVQYTIRRKKP